MTPLPAPGALAETATAPRRRVLKTLAYVAPAVVAIGLTAETAFASGGFKKGRVDAGRGNGPEGNPDPDPGKSGGRNRGGG